MTMEDIDNLVDDTGVSPAAPSVWNRPRTWLLGGGPSVAAGVVSWFLGGDDVWLWGTLGGFVLLVVVGIVTLRAAGALVAHNFRGGTVLWPKSPFFAACLGMLLTWAAWAGVGYFF